MKINQKTHTCLNEQMLLSVNIYYVQFYFKPPLTARFALDTLKHSFLFPFLCLCAKWVGKNAKPTFFQIKDPCELSVLQFN